jgi:monoamine oxidase
MSSSGTQAISQGIAQLIGHAHIHLSQPVSSIENLHSHVAVTTTTGNTYTARKCIVSIPSAMLRDLTIAPPLPQAVRHVTDSSKLGHYNKVLVCYDRPWWRELGYNGFFMSYDGPVALARDTSVEETRHYSLTCFVNGSHGERWSKLPPHERRRVVLHQLATIFNADPVASDVFKPIEVFDQIWKHEQYSKGALAPILALGHYTEYDSVYGKPVGNLHFVGTEYSREWKGYMEGALCSGEQGALEVVQALGQNARARL